MKQFYRKSQKIFGYIEHEYGFKITPVGKKEFLK